MMSTTKQTDVTATEVSVTSEPAVGGRCSPQVSSSPPSTKSVVVSRQASTASNGAGKSTVGEGAKQALSSGRKATEDTVGTSSEKLTTSVNRAAQRNVVDIGALSKDELLDKLRGYINSMCAFAQANKNVHKELKETLVNSNKVMTQYVKAVNLERTKQNHNPTIGSAGGSTHLMKCKTTQTETQTIQTTEHTEVEWMKERLIQQEEKLDIIMATITQYSNDTQSLRETANDGYAGPHSRNNDGGSWAEVVNKKGKAFKVNNPAAAPPPSKLSEARRVTKGASRHGVRIRPAAIVIDAASEEDFPALTQKIKSGISVGNNITGMRKTKKGSLLLEVRGDQDAVNLVRSEVSRAVGTGANVRQLQQRTMLEIRDIDTWSNRDDIADSIVNETSVKRDMVNVVSLKNVYGRSQTALVLLPTNEANAIVACGRINISVVSCRVRVAENRKRRCYRCLAFDHESKECRGMDRRNCCRRCGKVGHFAKDCTTEVKEAATFGELLRKETRSNGERTLEAEGILAKMSQANPPHSK